MDNDTSKPPGWYPLEELFHTVPYHSHVVVGVIMIVTLLLAVVGNGLVIYVFMCSRKLQSPSNVLVINLGVADMLMALTGFPLLIVNSFKARWAFPNWMCDFYGATATIFGLMSMNTLVFISLDRYVAIISPCNMNKVNYVHVRLCIGIIWFYSVIWGLFPVLGWNRYIVEGYGTTCSLDYFDRGTPSAYLLLTMLLADYVIPCIIVMTCYFCIFNKVRQHASSYHSILTRNPSQGQSPFTSRQPISADDPDGGGKSRKEWSNTDYKIAKTIFIVILFYLMAWTPYAIVTMIGQYGNSLVITPTLSMLPAVFAKFSTVYNPIIYSITHPRFKSEARLLFRRLLCQRGGGPLAVNTVGQQHRSLESTRSDTLSGQIKQYLPQVYNERAVETFDMGEMQGGGGGSGKGNHDSTTEDEYYPEGSEKQPLRAEEEEEEDEDMFEEMPEVKEDVQSEAKGGKWLKEFTSPEITEEEKSVLEKAMLFKKKLPNVIPTRHPAIHLLNKVGEDELTKNTRKDISGESLMCLNIEAIKMENNP